ncbi:MAG: hypothetical protein INH41_03030 [Myxococcaceae bacterium]|jgi:hypothetical protein|nr:hypothetical protein [Myxococcaceae bacterium]
MNGRTFTVAATTTDPLTAERLVAVLTDAGLDAFSRAGGAASANTFGAAEAGFFDVLVASEALERARPLIDGELEAIEAHAAENEQAAEEEALSQDNPTG